MSTLDLGKPSRTIVVTVTVLDRRVEGSAYAGGATLTVDVGVGATHDAVVAYLRDGFAKTLDSVLPARLGVPLPSPATREPL